MFEGLSEALQASARASNEELEGDAVFIVFDKDLQVYPPTAKRDNST